MCKRKLSVILLLLVLQISAAVISAQDTALFGTAVRWSGLDTPSALLIDLDGDGQSEILALKNGECLVYKALDRGFEVQAVLSIEGKRFVAVNAGDLDRDGSVEIVLGTDDLGYLAVYRWKEAPVLLGISRHTWKPVQHILLVDVDGDGRKHIFSVAPDGDTTLFRFSGNTVDAVWRGSKVFGDFRDFRIIQADGQGTEEILVVDKANGGLALYSWKQGVVRKWWENFPWGGVLDVTAGDVDGDGVTDILAITGRRMLYSFSFRNGTMVQKANPTELPSICSFLIHPAGEPGGIALFTTSSQLLYYLWTKNGPELRFRGEPAGRPAWAGRLRSTELIFALQTGDTVTLTRRLAEPPSVFRKDTLERWGTELRLINNHPYFSAQMVRKQLGLDIVWSSSGSGEGILNSWSGIYGFAAGSVELRLLLVPDPLPEKLSHPPLNVGGQLFLSHEMLNRVWPGSVRWDQDRQMIVLR